MIVSLRRSVAITALLGCMTLPAVFAQSNQRPCDRPEGRQLDFWLGEWDLTWPGGQGGTPQDGQGTGTNTITRILGDCIVHERFEGGATGLLGESWSVYNAGVGQWQQTWVDNQGSYLLFTGGMQDGVMDLRTAPRTTPQGTLVFRMIWTDVTGDSLDWRYQRSSDAGATWMDVWTIHYTRKP